MTEFLQTVARHYFDPLPLTTEGSVDYLQIADSMFVFPNRRAGLFFSKYLNDLNGQRPLIAPSMQTIGDLFGLFSQLRVPGRTALLFRLYHAYIEVKQQKLPAGQTVTEDFGDFVYWGEMLMRDFDDVDKYLADARQVFYNVRDYKDLNQVFGGLDEETLAVLRTFWRNIGLESVDGYPAKESFVQTWSIMYDVYSAFRQALNAEGLAYEGMRQRDVVERIQAGDPTLERCLDELPGRVVFVGITAIDEAERRLLTWLKEKGRAEFCWDYGDPRTRDFDFVRDNLRSFPNALTDEEMQAGVVSDADRQMTRMAVPSSVGQTAEASVILRGWSGMDALHTAVILPDEKLLSPMLHAIPAEYDDYNVTMGYSLKSTQTAALIDAVIALQNACSIRQDGSEPSFYYKAVLPILAHSYLTHLEPDRCADLRNQILGRQLYQVPMSKMAGCPMLQAIFRPVEGIAETVAYLDHLLSSLYAALRENGEEGDSVKDPGKKGLQTEEKETQEQEEEKQEPYALDLECLNTYRDLLRQLADEVEAAHMEGALDRNTLLHLLQKLAQGQTVSFSGEPVAGLQIMGVLETRALDFERIVILSMNEGTVPAKPTQSSFIPNTLRVAFGLPTQQHRDDIYAYHFFRLIARAREIHFLYDCRTEGMQSGEQSRYLMQLQYLSEGAHLVDRSPEVTVLSEEPYEVTVVKDNVVMDKLRAFTRGDTGRYITASNLKTYISCPLRFYLSAVEHLDVSDELNEEVADNAFGTILHGTLQSYYNHYVGHTVERRDLQEVLDHPNSLLADIRSLYDRQQGGGQQNLGYRELVCGIILDSVCGVLRHDLAVAPFRYVTSEGKYTLTYTTPTGLAVNVKGYYDRLDVVMAQDGSGQESLRIVDYKTGSPRYGSNKSRTLVTDLETACRDGGGCAPDAMQVLMYCLMLERMDDTALQGLSLTRADLQRLAGRIEPHLYYTRSFLSGREGEAETVIRCRQIPVGADGQPSGPGEDRPIRRFDDIRDDFERVFGAMIDEIFDPAVPFRQTGKAENCTNCTFLNICGKTKGND